MRIEKTNRWWDLLVVWPFVAVPLALVVVLLSVAVVGSLGEEAMPILVLVGLFGFLIYVSIIVAVIAGQVYAIHRLYLTTDMPEDKKRSIVILLVLFNVFAVPVVHFMYLRK